MAVQTSVPAKFIISLFARAKSAAANNTNNIICHLLRLCVIYAQAFSRYSAKKIQSAIIAAAAKNPWQEHLSQVVLVRHGVLNLAHTPICKRNANVLGLTAIDTAHTRPTTILVGAVVNSFFLAEYSFTLTFDKIGVSYTKYVQPQQFLLFLPFPRCQIRASCLSFH